MVASTTCGRHGCGRRWLSAVAICLTVSGCASLGSNPEGLVPGRSIRRTLERSIRLIEHYECERFAVEFLSPIKREQIPDLAAYRASRACSPTDRGNLDDVLLALRLALGAEPEIHGVRATIDLSGIGTLIQTIELVKYVDGRWYFNAF